MKTLVKNSGVDVLVCVKKENDEFLFVEGVYSSRTEAHKKLEQRNSEAKTQNHDLKYILQSRISIEEV